MEINSSVRIEYLNDLWLQFEKLYYSVDNLILYGRAKDELIAFVFSKTEHQIEEASGKFVICYNNMRNDIFSNRDLLIRKINATEFKDEKSTVKMKLKYELMKYNRLCRKLNKFENEFEEKVGVPLLSVANENKEQF